MCLSKRVLLDHTEYYLPKFRDDDTSPSWDFFLNNIVFSKGTFPNLERKCWKREPSLFECIYFSANQVFAISRVPRDVC